jgi:hypothetical protein
LKLGSNVVGEVGVGSREVGKNGCIVLVHVGERSEALRVCCVGLGCILDGTKCIATITVVGCGLVCLQP